LRTMYWENFCFLCCFSKKKKVLVLSFELPLVYENISIM
jgi:hypothetical protein